MVSPLSLTKATVATKSSVRHTGILYRAPDEAFMASAVAVADLYVGMTIASTPAHSHVRAIAPKFRTSVTPSIITTNGLRPAS